MKRVGCIGAGYVGGPTMVVAATKCPDLDFHIVDLNQERIDAWNSDNLPVYEPGLDELVRVSRGRNLTFSTQVEKCIDESDVLFVSVNTPTKTYGIGAGSAADLTYWEKAARLIARTATSKKIIVTKSTVPVGTSAELKRILSDSPHGHELEVVSNPEFLAEGVAVDNLLRPDRVLIGNESTPSGYEAGKAVASIYEHWVPKEKILLTNLWSSELSKLAANAFLAQRISSINAISALCEASGADVREIQGAIGTDTRIGSKFLQSGPGFGGSCFRKDVLDLVFLCRSYGLHEAAEYWEGVITINDYQQTRLVGRMLREMFNTLAGRRLAIFGAAFKENTGDVRESPSLAICKHLLDERAHLVITDPKALPGAQRELPNDANIEYIEDPYEAADGAHAIIVLTGWNQYKSLDYERIYKNMVHPAFVFDTRNILNHGELAQMGYNVFATGRQGRVCS